MDPEPYLRRLGLGREAVTPPSAEGLRRLQRAHLEAVPFENSSVLRGEPIVLRETLLVDKLVAAGRGGYCFELNGAFAALLRALGYRVDRLPGRFWSASGLGPPEEHLALGVDLDGARWLVDVGAGYSFREPLLLEVDVTQADPSGEFRLVRTLAGDALDVEWRHRDGAWRPHYRFEDRPVDLAAFEARCEELRTSPESPFTQGWICARALPGGWATLDGDHLVVSDGDARPVDELVAGAALDEAIQRWFGVAPAVP